MIPIGEMFSQKSAHFGLRLLENFMFNSSSACQTIYGDNSIAKLPDIQKKIREMWRTLLWLQTWNPTIWEERGKFLKSPSCKLTNSTFCSTSKENKTEVDPHKAVSSCAKLRASRNGWDGHHGWKTKSKTQQVSFGRFGRIIPPTAVTAVPGPWLLCLCWRCFVKRTASKQTGIIL